MNTEHASAYIAALTGDANTIMDFRAIHDVDKTVQAQNFRGTLTDVASSLDAWNVAGYGIFVIVNETDGIGRSAENVKRARAAFIDYDIADVSWAMLQAIRASENPPTFYVTGAIPGKFHAYWVTEPYTDLERFEPLQRRLIAQWRSDPPVIDLPRVMRLPGSLHMKKPAAPVMVSYVEGSGKRYSVGQIEWQYSGVPLPEGGGGSVDALGTPGLAAPSLEWAVYALNKIDPNKLARDEWIKITAAFKQAAWSHADEATVNAEWLKWCARYAADDLGENNKQWRSIRGTKAGWPMLGRQSGAIFEMAFGSPVAGGQSATPVPAPPLPGATPKPTNLDTTAAFLNPLEQVEYFKGCIYVSRMGRILTPERRYLDPGKFNGSYGGKIFILSADGAKTTDEPWKAATRGQVYRVPKVDHTRFLPSLETGAIVADELGRLGVNTYRPALVRMTEGDASPFIALLRALLATEDDVRILINYLAHVVQRPGHKAFWAPVIQSMEGAGKGIIGGAITYAVGSIYVHAPNAKELVDAGSKFNIWMKDKLLIIANEIRVDEKRDMLDVLKPMITEDRIEIQSKGVDQEMEDNLSNWIMFTNFKDAIPVKKDSRRYAIFYSPLQSMEDLQARGMDGTYFPKLYAWLKGAGREHVAWFLKNYPIDAQYDPAGAAHRAPVTSSTAEAVVRSFSRVESAIAEAIEGDLPGFRNGWLSSAAVARLLREQHIPNNPGALNEAFTGLGYKLVGRFGSKVFQEEIKQPYLWRLNGNLRSMHDYRHDQGYEP